MESQPVFRILFVCHGNICRSPMAEFVMKDLLRRAGITNIQVDSGALHTDEIGNDIHPGTRAKLREEGIPFQSRTAWLLDSRKAREYDMLIGMDLYNRRDLERMLPTSEHWRIHLLLDWSPTPRNIADPWYTGNFNETYQDIREGCRQLLEHIQTTLL